MPPSPVLTVGMSCRLQGLKGAAELNGFVGVLQEFDEEQGRWFILLPDGQEKMVKPENCQPEQNFVGQTVEPPQLSVQEPVPPVAVPIQDENQARSSAIDEAAASLHAYKAKINLRNDSGGTSPSMISSADLLPGQRTRSRSRERSQGFTDGSPPGLSPAGVNPFAFLKVGMRCRLQGLSAAAELNGVVGTLQEFDYQSGRWCIVLSDGQEKMVKPENCLAEETVPPQSSMQQQVQFSAAMEKLMDPGGGGPSDTTVSVATGDSAAAKGPKSKPGGGTSILLCRDFKAGHCKFGDRCTWPHDIMKVPECIQHKLGRCYHGAECRRRHGPDGKG